MNCIAYSKSFLFHEIDVYIDSYTVHLAAVMYCGGGINEVANEKELSCHSAPAQPPSEDSLWYDNDL